MRWIRVSMILLAICSGVANAASLDEATVAYAQVLQRYVDDQGLVDYAELQKNRQPLELYLQTLATLPRSNYEKLSEPEQIAFWLNAYNASVLQTIINHYPIKKRFPASLAYPNGIQQINNVWKDKRHQIIGESLSLDDIEHIKLRKNFHEPRIHMALVCAAKGCPQLRREPYRGAQLEQQLQAQSQDFIHNPAKCRLDIKRKRLNLSKIFDWFGDDFGKPKNKAIFSFISPFLSSQEQAFLQEHDVQIHFMSYDWGLNAQ